MQFERLKDDASIIKVIGVGGGGGNAINHMYKQGIKGVDFIICNTDAQALELSPIPNKIQLGSTLTEGRGAGSMPDVGKHSAIENIEEIKTLLGNTKMVFITAGMGGGTGTGASPIIAQACRELGILTVGIVTTPFAFEGKRRRHQAEEGLEELKKNVDTLLVISNDKMREMFGNLTLSSAFGEADDILTTAAKGIAEIITVPGYINVDFEDVRTVMKDSGAAIMGSCTSKGEDRARKAVVGALSSPLLNDNEIEGARYILLNISSGTNEVLMDEVTIITDYIQEEAGLTADIIWGNCFDSSLEDELCVTIIATGFQTRREKENGKQKLPEKIVKVLRYDEVHEESHTLQGRNDWGHSRDNAPVSIRDNSRINSAVNSENHSGSHHDENRTDEPYLKSETIVHTREIFTKQENTWMPQQSNSPSENHPVEFSTSRSAAYTAGHSESFTVGHSGSSDSDRSTGSSVSHSAGATVGHSFGSSVGRSTESEVGHSAASTAGHSGGSAVGHSTGSAAGHSTGSAGANQAINSADHRINQSSDIRSGHTANYRISHSIDRPTDNLPTDNRTSENQPGGTSDNRASNNQPSVTSDNRASNNQPGGTSDNRASNSGDNRTSKGFDQTFGSSGQLRDPFLNDRSVRPENGSEDSKTRNRQVSIFDQAAKDEVEKQAEKPQNSFVPELETPKKDIQMNSAAVQDENAEDDPMRKTRERIMRLKELSMKLRTTKGIEDLENVPAYIRKQQKLDKVPYSSHEEESRFTTDDRGEIRPNNSFLHDNVD